MKRKHILLIILSSLLWCASMLAWASLLNRIVIPDGVLQPGEGSAVTFPLFWNFIRLLRTGSMLLFSMAVLLLILGIIAATYLFPPAALALAIFSVFRRKKISWKALRPSVFLLLISLGCSFSWSLFVNGSGYVFHHDFGSKVYNEGYIIPYYEDKYQDTLELADKHVIDSCNAVYTLRSGITGKTFTVESKYYDTNSGGFDMLHLSSDYQNILGERLQAGETISLPFGDDASLLLDDGSYCWLYVYKTQGGYKLYIKGDVEHMDQEFHNSVKGKRYSIRLEEGALVITVPLMDGTVSTHDIAITPDISLTSPFQLPCYAFTKNKLIDSRFPSSFAYTFPPIFSTRILTIYSPNPDPEA